MAFHSLSGVAASAPSRGQEQQRQQQQQQQQHQVASGHPAAIFAAMPSALTSGSSEEGSNSNSSSRKKENRHEVSLQDVEKKLDDREQQQLQQRGQNEQAGGSRKRGREFEWQEAKGGENASPQGLPARLVGPSSAAAVTKLLMKLACLYEIEDPSRCAVYCNFAAKNSQGGLRASEKRSAEMGRGGYLRHCNDCSPSYFL
ncbi:hypothetical protein Emag_003171 [Eimeria magna]